MSVQHLAEWFWNDEVWLPPNVTWKDLESTDQVQYSNFRDLCFPIPAALAVILLRHLVERIVFRPIGVLMGLRPHRHRQVSPIAALERHYQKSSRLSQEEIAHLADQSKMSHRQVERWFRKRIAQDRPTTLEKFAETGWRWFYYTGIFLYGLICLWNKPWLWDIKHCWMHYPRHPVPRDVWWYYMIELSFYWSLAISQFFDVKRKDFWEMFVHHAITIALMSFSWTCNLTRVGTLVLVIHDCADIFLEAAKLCKYTNYQLLCDCFFGCFTLTWIVTRLGVYPTWILYSTTIEAPQIVEMFPAYYLFNGLLAMLLILHVIWTYFILKILYKAMYTGKTEKDTRSDSSAVTLSSNASSLEEENHNKQD
eukprot:maker-scaffold43_size480169-snap-gene-2.25 protein:Tk12731 transcript:maker-scaffold43_size480169-snap-gene-2.25-mRNA-1 annotation:"lag1 longevity assurance homolog 6"